MRVDRGSGRESDSLTDELQSHRMQIIQLHLALDRAAQRIARLEQSTSHRLAARLRRSAAGASMLKALHRLARIQKKIKKKRAAKNTKSELAGSTSRRSTESLKQLSRTLSLVDPGAAADITIARVNGHGMSRGEYLGAAALYFEAGAIRKAAELIDLAAPGGEQPPPRRIETRIRALRRFQEDGFRVP